MDKREMLILIPKYEEYMMYIIGIILKLPRTEKFSIGTEYKMSMYETIKEVLYINKRKENCRLDSLNAIDAHIMVHRVYLRIMKREKWIDEQKFDIAICKIYEIGKIIGGLTKYYEQKNTK